jgi:hypothetical protein
MAAANGLSVHVEQRKGDRQWTIRVRSSNGRLVGWSGEFYKRKKHAVGMAATLFQGIHGDPIIEPAPRNRG